jgi:hypothetical protein
MDKGRRSPDRTGRSEQGVRVTQVHKIENLAGSCKWHIHH